MAKFLLTIYGDETAQDQATPQQLEAVMKEWYAYEDAIRASGVHLAGDALQPTATARTVRGVPGGEPTVTDGPFAETKEQLGGFYLVECKDMDEALEWARKMPTAKFGGSVEARPIQEFPPQE
jgi:hypothetical protein